MNDLSRLDKYTEGGIVFHKATGQKSVVLTINDNGTITVKTSDDKEKTYLPQELQTEEEYDELNSKLVDRKPKRYLY